MVSENQKQVEKYFQGDIVFNFFKTKFENP